MIAEICRISEKGWRRSSRFPQNPMNLCSAPISVKFLQNVGAGGGKGSVGSGNSVKFEESCEHSEHVKEIDEISPVCPASARNCRKLDICHIS